MTLGNGSKGQNSTEYLFYLKRTDSTVLIHVLWIILFFEIILF